MKILVTGAGGFIGKYVVKILLKEGHNLYAFSRSKYDELENLGVTCITGDISNENEVLNASTGMDAIFHIASKVGMWGTWDSFYNTNVIGTKNVIAACEKNNIQRLIYTSTPSVVFGNEDICNETEEISYPDKYLNYYAHTKSIAEKLVLEANNSQSLCTVALRPHLVFGPEDKNLIPRLVDSARKGRLKIVGDGNNLVDVLYVENAAQAHVNAFKELSPKAKCCGKAYFLGQNEPVKLWSFINKILELKGVNPITKKIPTKVVYFVGYLVELFLKTFRIFDVHPIMTRFVALQLSKSHYFNHEAAKAEINFDPIISTNEALKKI